MSEIFYSDEMKRFEQEQFLKRSSYSLMQKAGDQIFKFINNNFKNNKLLTHVDYAYLPYDKFNMIKSLWLIIIQL